jgi:UDP-2,3-diacylglucosamine hydrolase
MSVVMHGFAEIVAPPGWRSVDFLSDLHLQAGEPATFDAWHGYLETTPADAIFILGDLFELWIGDDAAALPGFEARCAQLLRQASDRRPVYFMHGNRDFLVGASFAQRCGMTLLDDPTVLVMHGQRWVLTHGDALCLGDTEYLAFRARVRTPEWQQDFLARPLEERRSLGRSMRTRSEDRKRDPDAVWADVDGQAALDWLRRADSSTLVHGHTHRPGEHVLDARSGERRVVLSDWDAAARPPRAQVVCLSATGLRRVDLR